MMNTPKQQADKLYRLRNNAAIRRKSAAARERNRHRFVIAELRERQASGETKVCGECGITKSLAEFALNRTLPDGFDSLCKQCRNTVRKVYAQAKKMRLGVSP